MTETDGAWRELCDATTELGRAAARWELARAAYVEASRTRPRTRGGCPTFTTAPAQVHPQSGPPA